jgi:hypothetical protein
MITYYTEFYQFAMKDLSIRSGGAAVRWIEGHGWVQEAVRCPSFALVDHIRSVDKRRVHRIFGQVSPTELANVDQGLDLFLGLGGTQ